MSQKFTESFSKFGPQLAKVITVGSVGIGGSVWAFKNCLFNVDAGHRAIKFSRIGGLKEDLYTEGTHVMVPWFERPITFDIRTKPRTLVSLTGSKDLQMVSISLRTLCRPREDKLPAIYRYAGTDYDEKVAQQQAEKAKYQVLKAQEMKKNIIIKAQGEMESAKMIGSAIQNNPGFVELRKIDAAKEIAHHMAVSRNKMVLNSDSLLLNLMSSGNERLAIEKA
ncbi:Prohibitin-2, subunit of the prohibitin complex (Phb1p-Phb2p) [Perkinsus olseni]|uniref:Prohibitin n=1 Tax=Perkinsus olseni TaxID=32597 RepID=A0A7J6LW17_PEROL|nr:Prohibitin-2, subunit of the prohibitin complex (Phb1p-Phb2p) [Perkinsus olseni]